MVIWYKENIIPRAFNKQESVEIRTSLKANAHQLFVSQGVLKTSIEQITSAAAIAKGSFYKFYASKELLFFELLEETQNAIRTPLITIKSKQQTPDRQQLERLLHKMFEQISNDPLIQYMGQDKELLAIRRKVPAETLIAHQQDDQDFIDALIMRWNNKAKPPLRDVVAARMTLLLLISLKQDFLGPRLLTHAVSSAVVSLADCFFSSETQR